MCTGENFAFIVYRNNQIPCVHNKIKTIIKLAEIINGEGFEDIEPDEVEDFLVSHQE